MDKDQLMDVIKHDIYEDKAFLDLYNGATNLVLGEGSLDSNVVFVGEAPGKKEDMTGLPFVGSSGKFLDEMLSSIKLSRDDIYITNIVKYRPPNNRDPSKKEKLDFWMYLVRQLEVIQPRIIVTLGRHSMNSFLPDKSISECHGDVFDIKINDINYILIPLYHPAAALYNGNLRQTLIKDFSVIRKTMLAT